MTFKDLGVFDFATWDNRWLQKVSSGYIVAYKELCDFGFDTFREPKGPLKVLFLDFVFLRPWKSLKIGKVLCLGLKMS